MRTRRKILPSPPFPAQRHFRSRQREWCSQLEVMADSGSCVRGSLLQLQESLSAADRCGAAVARGQLLRGLGQECVLSSGPALLGGYSSGLRTAGARQPVRVRVGTRGGA